NLPEGYLFLCPLEDLQDKSGRWLPSPECPAYWSLDPSGRQRLSPEEAYGLGFPPLQLEVEFRGWSWHENVYAALSRFHAAKGFDPHTQNLARNYGFPLYQLTSGPNAGNADSEYEVHISWLSLTRVKMNSRRSIF
ncbi:hypothetical protein K438DRAFT_1644773, partial [Mycena galopus ATCC 62051]